MKDKLLLEIKEYLISKYQCHTVILYGSYATENYNDESDVDLVCFYDGVENKNDNSYILNKQLDTWIYNTEEVNHSEQFLHIRNGILLIDERGLGRKLLGEIELLYMKGPEPIRTDEIEFLKNWLDKMLNRSLRGDSEGNYRLHWLLKDSLEIYFKLQNRWYFGPKKSIQWLQEHDQIAYTLFSNALHRNASNKDIEILIDYIVKN
ncbi:nucleotidyltransferase domain-containing protein [Paenibacillus gallinarum]|uniref:Nucleotidyltransferase domain-containing protein n=1 Tax=Paenibacillus gallinarum TaxID=2762232 RepID=A0ABR8T0G6_9BACL|nr:nucleotidyltransferase domain-containing protein [Paenibacillus gallinarum]MBD7969265.1 nucleotidyltransferase domain-containing protein [Paenibacillus gallinarum]